MSVPSPYGPKGRRQECRDGWIHDHPWLTFFGLLMVSNTARRVVRGPLPTFRGVSYRDTEKG